MLRKLPGKEERMDFILCRSTLGDDLQILRVDRDVLVGLDQHAALDLLDLVLPVLGGRTDRHSGPEDADVLFGLHNLHGTLVVIGANHGFDEMLGDLLGRSYCAVPVEAYDASKSRKRIHIVGGDESLIDGIGGCESAGVRMLHHHRSGPLEVHADVHGLVQVQDVVVGELLPMELLRLGDRGSGREWILVERGLLIRILPVSEILDLLRRYREGVGEALPEPVEHLGRDHSIVVRCEDEGVRHELLVHLERQLAAQLQPVYDLVVLRGLGDHCDIFVVLGAGPYHAGAAYVDVLDDIFEGDALFQNGLLERIEVDDHHVDGLDALLGDGIHMLLDVPAGQDARVDLRMKRLDATLEHLRESSNLGDLYDRDAGVFQDLVRPPGGDYLHSHGGKRLGEIDDPRLVGNADDCSVDLGQCIPSLECSTHRGRCEGHTCVCGL